MAKNWLSFLAWPFSLGSGWCGDLELKGQNSFKAWLSLRSRVLDQVPKHLLHWRSQQDRASKSLAKCWLAMIWIFRKSFNTLGSQMKREFSHESLGGQFYRMRIESSAADPNSVLNIVSSSNSFLSPNQPPFKSFFWFSSLFLPNRVSFLCLPLFARSQAFPDL